MTPLQQWNAVKPFSEAQFFVQVGIKTTERTDTAGIAVSARDMITIGMFGAIGAGLGYSIAKKFKKSALIPSSIGAAAGIGALFLVVNRSGPESGPVIQQT